MEEAVPVPDEAVSLAVVNAVGEHDDEIEERVNDVMNPLIDVFQDFLGKDGDAAQSLLDETKAQVSGAIAGIITAELAEHLTDGREALLIGRDIGDPERGVVAEYCEDVVNSIDANMRDYVTSALKTLEKGQSDDAASAKDIAAAIGQALKENVLPTIVEAADNKAEEIEKDFEKYEKAVENRSEVVDVASGLTNYVAAMSVRDGAFNNIKEAFSELLSEDDATVVAAVAATRAAGTASQALENAMTDLLDQNLGKKFDDEDTTAAAEYVMTHVMEKFGELLKGTSFQKLLGDLPSEAETVDEKIKALSSAIEAAIVDVAFDAVRKGVDKEVTSTIRGGADGIKAELFLAEFDNWKETSTTLGTPSASNYSPTALAKISLPKEVEITVGEADSGGSSGPSAAMDTKLGSAAAPEVGITGSTGASASAGASDGSPWPRRALPWGRASPSGQPSLNRPSPWERPPLHRRTPGLPGWASARPSWPGSRSPRTSAGATSSSSASPPRAMPQPRSG